MHPIHTNLKRLRILAVALVVTMPGCQDTKEFFSRMGPVESPTCDETTPAPQAEIATPPSATPIPTTTPIATDIEAPTTLNTQSQQAQAFSIPLRDIGEGTADSVIAPVSETADAAASPPATAQPTTLPQIKIVDTPKPADQKTPSAVSSELKGMLKDPEQNSDAAIQQALLQAMQEQKEAEQQQEKQPQTTTDGLIKPPTLAAPGMTTPSFNN